MTKDKALAILLQPDRIGCNLIKANDEESNKYNQESIEALNIAIKSVNKLGQIEKIVNDWKNGNIEGNDTILAFHMIKEVLENE